MGDGDGHAVLNPKQPKPPIQKQLHLQPTHQHPYSTTQNPSRITQQITVLRILTRIPKLLPINTRMPIRSS